MISSNAVNNHAVVTEIYNIKDLFNRLYNTHCIIILGSPGSGKTTLSKKITRVFNYRSASMDELYWHAGWNRPDIDEFHYRVVKFMEKDGPWILDGMYLNHLFIERIKMADVIIVMAQPFIIRMYLFLKRMLFEWLTGRKKTNEIRPRFFKESYRIFRDKIVPFANKDFTYILDLSKKHKKKVYVVRRQ